MIIKIDQSKLSDQAKQDRVAELKQLLADSDFRVLPDYDQPNDDIKAQRLAWRAEIRQLQE